MAVPVRPMRPLPSLCQRCYQPVSRLARTCPACGEPLGRMSLLRIVSVLAGVLMVLAAIIACGYLFVYVYLHSPD